MNKVTAFLLSILPFLAIADDKSAATTFRVTPYYFYYGDARSEDLIAIKQYAQFAPRDVNWTVIASECASELSVRRTVRVAQIFAGAKHSVVLLKSSDECFK